MHLNAQRNSYTGIFPCKRGQCWLLKGRDSENTLRVSFWFLRLAGLDWENTFQNSCDNTTPRCSQYSSDMTNLQSLRDGIYPHTIESSKTGPLDILFMVRNKMPFLPSGEDNITLYEIIFDIWIIRKQVAPKLHQFTEMRKLRLLINRAFKLFTQ